MRKLLFQVGIVGLALVAVVTLFPRHARASTTSLVGTFKDPQGNPVNGTLVMELAVSAQDTSTNQLIVPNPVTYNIVNGAIQSGPPIYDNVNMQPQGNYYTGKVYDTSGTLMMEGNFVVPAGATFDIGTAAPTNITTSNISYSNPAFTNVANVWTAPQTFTQPIVSTVATGTAPFTLASTTLNTNLNAQLWNGVADNTATVAGQTCVTTDATHCTWASSSTAGYKLECVNMTQNTVANTIVGTNLSTCVIPANDIGANQTIEIQASGTFSCASSCSGAFSNEIAISLDGTLLNSAGIGHAGAVGQPWSLQAFFSGISAGVTGSLANGALFWTSTPSISSQQLTTAPTVTIDTTVSHTLAIKMFFSSASASDSITEYSLTVFRIG